jgi:hypothetical protein
VDGDGVATRSGSSLVGLTDGTSVATGPTDGADGAQADKSQAIANTI